MLSCCHRRKLRNSPNRTMQSLYDPLNRAAREIRLLGLLPAENPADPIRCTLQNVSLSTNPFYIALSYCWGTSAERSSIYVNDIQFPATLNLCAALRRMRSDSQGGTLWVDAVCINQADNVEKSGQIPMMKDIYTDASIVTVWLGEQENYSELVMRLISVASHLYEQDENVGPATHQAMIQLLEVRGVLPALGDFLQRDWWSRVWVIQEIAVAQRGLLLCGDKAITWREFINAFLLWTVMLRNASERSEFSIPLHHLDSIIRGTSARTLLSQHGRLNGTEQPGLVNPWYGLQEMLEESWNFDSTDPLDKVYAWIGLSNRTDVTITPDYDETPARVYAGLVKCILELKGSTKLVAFTGSGLREARPIIEGLPSWAPDLRKEAIGPSGRASIWLFPKTFTASSDLSAVGSVSDDLKTLEVSAVKIGRIELIDASRNENDGGALGDKLCRWLYLVLGRKPHLSSNIGPVHDALFRILVLFYHPLHLGLPLIDNENERPDINNLRLGYMAYVGYNDRVQDYLLARHALAGRNTTTTVPPSVETSRRANSGPATTLLPETVRPESMTRTPFNSVQDRLPPRPTMVDFSNILRFFDLWNIDINLETDSCAYLRLLRELLQRNPTLPPDLSDWNSSFEEFQEPLPFDNTQRFIREFAKQTAGKSLFVTESGYLGLGLNATRADDFVCIIRGCSLPVVVREHDGGDYFEVVGQCYTWGTMYGEFVETMQTRGLEWEMMTFR
ncbi:HET domain containing protein [Hyaloscypha variabilis]